MKGCLKEERSLMSLSITLPALLSSQYSLKGSMNGISKPTDSVTKENGLRCLG